MIDRIHIKYLKSETIKYFSTPDNIITLNKGQYLYRQEDNIEYVYLIKEGTLLLSKQSSDGRELSIKFAREGDLLFEMHDDHQKQVNDAKVVERTIVYVYSLLRIMQSLKKDPQALIDILNYKQLTNQRDMTRFRDLMLYGKKGALYSTLIRLSNSFGLKDGDDIVITKKMTNQDFADFCATSRESVNRLLNELKNKNVIHFDHQHLIIHDLAFLKKEIHCDQCPAHHCTID